jgi:hypothetical protein
LGSCDPYQKRFDKNFNCKKTDELVAASPHSEFSPKNISNRTMFISKNKYRQFKKKIRLDLNSEKLKR